jgi:hypothetical protein
MLRVAEVGVFVFQNEKPQPPFDGWGSPYGTRLFLLLGKAKELLHLIVVVETNDEHGVVMVMVDHIGNTDTTASEEGDGMVHIVPTDNRVIGEVEGLLGSHEVERVVALPVLFVVADDDPDLVKGIETDVD